MGKIKIVNWFVVAFYVLSLSFLCYAKQGSEHAQDQLYVLGLWNESKLQESKENLKLMNGLLRTFNLGIDDEYSIFLDQLKTKYPGFNWGDYTHRLLYHWGYDYGDPSNHKALSDACIDKLGDYSKCMSLIDDVKKEQKDREARMTNAIASFFKTNVREFNHAIGAIIYYTHLLGDHIQHSNKKTDLAVFSTYNIKSRIKTEVDKLAHNLTLREKAQKELTAFNNAWRVLKNRDLSNEAEAQAVIDVLAKHLPPILEKIYGNTFKNTGVKFVYSSGFFSFF